jgi:hypothetical protein
VGVFNAETMGWGWFDRLLSVVRTVGRGGDNVALEGRGFLDADTGLCSELVDAPLGTRESVLLTPRVSKDNDRGDCRLVPDGALCGCTGTALGTGDGCTLRPTSPLGEGGKTCSISWPDPPGHTCGFICVEDANERKCKKTEAQDAYEMRTHSVHG